MTTMQRNMTPGLLTALQKQNEGNPCVGCGFPMPKYPGRYPTKCPNCGAERAKPPELKDAT